MNAPAFHAVVLAGGRSSRLGGRPKAALRQGKLTLVELTVDAVREAAGVVVVGPAGLAVPGGVLRTRDDPPFAGPAAGIAAGLAALAALPSAPWTMTLACDMPGVAGAVDRLRGAAQRAPDAAGFMAITPGGRRQPLAALYRTEVLLAAYAGQDPVDRSVRSFTHDLALQGSSWLRAPRRTWVHGPTCANSGSAERNPPKRGALHGQEYDARGMASAV